MEKLDSIESIVKELKKRGITSYEIGENTTIAEATARKILKGGDIIKYKHQGDISCESFPLVWFIIDPDEFQEDIEQIRFIGDYTTDAILKFPNTIKFAI